MNPEWARALCDTDPDALARQLGDGADVDEPDRYGQTGLMLAAIRGNMPTVRWLVDHGANLDHRAKFGLTALMLAVVNGHQEVVRALVAAGADLTLQGSGAPGFAGLTALDLARARGDDEMIAILDTGSSTNRR